MVQPGEHELVKVCVHGGMLIGAALAAAYNARAWWVRLEPRHARNTVVYLALVAWEIPKVQRHLRQGRFCNDGKTFGTDRILALARDDAALGAIRAASLPDLRVS